jgi:DNA-binding helix-hairpin-helix protein with protein kinase domain
MTKPLSLPLERQTVLIDVLSRPVPMGKQIGRGGEGAIFEVDGQPSLVAKVYHKRPLPAEQVAKIEAMAACWSKALETIAAWPRAVLFDSASRQPSGLLMSKMEGAKPLHELYGTTNRRRHFPEVGWHHLVLAARNTAAAFQTLHGANIVVGDVNQGNLLVDKAMCVRMIDCDSFQLSWAGRTFGCPVGTPHFTPPELQSQKLRDVERTVYHDRFGLAVLIFHLLFVGRHPFAGRYRGLGDLSIEKAIAERRFAFSKDKAVTLVDPPPASLLLSDLPPSTGELFERAFRSDENNTSERPGPHEWVYELDELLKHRKNCAFDTTHVYYSQLGECPWCRIEDSGGPTFFVPASGMTMVTADRLASLDSRIWDLRPVEFADLPSQRLALPKRPVLRKVKEVSKRSWPDLLAALMAVSWLACFAGGLLGGTIGLATLAAGTLLSVAFASALIRNRVAQSRRKVCDEQEDWLVKTEQSLARRAQTIEQQHRQREQMFERTSEEIKNETETYRTAADNIRDVIVQHREAQKADYLRTFIIRDYARKIPALTPSEITMLESYGIESANDADRLKLYGVPGIDPESQMELLQWRRDVEQGFVFNPDHGITLQSVGLTKEIAVRRLKIALARKILAAAKQTEVMADVAKTELARALTKFDEAAEQYKATAKQFRDVQSARWPLERRINKSPVYIVGLALGVPFVAFLLYLI